MVNRIDFIDARFHEFAGLVPATPSAPTVTLLADPVVSGLVHLGISTVSIFVVGQLLPGIKVGGLMQAFVFALTVAFLNALFWHFLSHESFATVLFAGPGSILGNAILFWLASKLVKDVEVSGCITALIAAIGVTFVNGMIRFGLHL